MKSDCHFLRLLYHISFKSFFSQPILVPCPSTLFNRVHILSMFFLSNEIFVNSISFLDQKSSVIALYLGGQVQIVCSVINGTAAAADAKSLQSRPTLCNPIDGSPPGSPVPGILQARTLEWVAISFSSAWKRKVKVKSLSCVQLFATPWTAAYQDPPSMGFSRQEYWSGLPLPSPINDFRMNC